MATTVTIEFASESRLRLPANAGTVREKIQRPSSPRVAWRPSAGAVRQI